VQSQRLLTQSQVFEDEVLPGTESAHHPPKGMPERHDHGKNLTGTVGIELFYKSYILRVYEVLARHTDLASTERRRPAVPGRSATSLRRLEEIVDPCHPGDRN
jgi:hypothetical protein